MAENSNREQHRTRAWLFRDGHCEVHRRPAPPGGDACITVADTGTITVTIDNDPVANIGAALGSKLGQVLGGNSVLGQFAAGTLASAIGRTIGFTLNNGSFFDLASDLLTHLVNIAFQDFSANFTASFQSAGIGQLASFLMAEIADEIGLDGFEGAVFQGVGASITGRLLDNAVHVTLSHTNPATGQLWKLADGFDPGALFGSISGVVGGILGSSLGAQLVMPETPEAALGGSIGSSIGGLLGTIAFPIPFLGTFMGAFAGQIFGTMIGGIFGETPQVTVAVWYDPTAEEFMWGGSATGGGNPAPFLGIAESHADMLNALVGLTGGKVDSSATLGPGAQLIGYNQSGPAFALLVNNQSVFSTPFASDEDFEQIGPKLDPALLSVIHGVDILGGDILMRRAWENSPAINVTAFATDLQFAQDYRFYLDNAPLINAIMASAPESAFTTGWALTLLKAEELGLNKASVEDFQGGILAHLGNQIGDYADWRPSVDPLEADTLILTSADGLTQKAFDNVFGPEATHRVAHGDDADTIDLAALPVEKLVYVTAGGGNDTVTGSAGTDLIDGGAGNDVINGGGGHDWVYGGAGNDTLAGGDGDDLVVGDAGDDVLTNDAGVDTLIGGAGNDVFVFNTIDALDTVVATSIDAGAQYDIIQLGAGIDDEASTFTRSGVDLVITARIGTWSQEEQIIDGVPQMVWVFDEESSGEIVVKDFYLTKSGIDRVEFANGSFWTNAQLWAPLWVPPGSPPSEHTFYADDGSRREVRIDGASTQPWVSKDTRVDASNQVTTQITHWDDGTSTVAQGAAGTIQGTSGNNSIDGGNTAETILGLAGNDTITGGAGNDILDGGTGNDTMAGGVGDDTYKVDSLSDVITESANQGTDTAIVTVTNYALAANVEVGTVGTAASTTLSGNGLNNTLFGNDGNDTLYGLAGNDTIHGGTGNDTIDGGTGNDTMLGGTGDDTYTIDSLSDVTTENAGEGSDWVAVSVSGYTMAANVEGAYLTLAAGLVLTGNTLNNSLAGHNGNDTISGGAGNDTIYGYVGNDTLDGGTGNDTLIGGTGNDTYHFGIGSGQDTVDSSDGGTDKVVYGAGITAATLSYASVGNDLVISIAGTGDSLTIKNWMLGHQVAFQLANGTAMTVALGTSGDDTYRVAPATTRSTALPATTPSTAGPAMICWSAAPGTIPTRLTASATSSPRMQVTAWIPSPWASTAIRSPPMSRSPTSAQLRAGR